MTWPGHKEHLQKQGQQAVMEVKQLLNCVGRAECLSAFADNSIGPSELRSLTADDLGEMGITGPAAQDVLWAVKNAIPTHDWLAAIELPDQLKAFTENRVEFSQIGSLDKSDLKEMGISVLGHRKKILANSPSSSDETNKKESESESSQSGDSPSLRDSIGAGAIVSIDEMKGQSHYQAKIVISIGKAIESAGIKLNHTAKMALGATHSADRGETSVYFSIELRLHNWWHTNDKPLLVLAGGERYSLKQGSCNKEVISGDRVTEDATYHMSPGTLKAILSGGDIKVRIGAQYQTPDITIPSASLQAWRWFYQSLFDEEAFPDAIEAMAQAVRETEERQAEKARKRKEMIGNVAGFIGGFTGSKSKNGKSKGGLGELRGKVGELSGLLGGKAEKQDEQVKPSGNTTTRLIELANKMKSGEISAEEFASEKKKLLQ
jgi:hypothetical protein